MKEKSKEEIDSTEEEIPQDVTLEELEEDQHRHISPEHEKKAEEYIKKAGLKAIENNKFEK